MKKALSIISVLSAGLFLFSCKSTEQTSTLTENDAYGEIAEVTEIKEDSPENKSAKTKNYDPYNEKKMRPTDRSLGEKILGTNRFDVLDEVYMYVKPMVGKPKVKKGNFIYRRGTDIGGFQIYYDTTAYAVQFAYDARKTLCNAVDLYLADFEDKKLDVNAKASKTRALYGSTAAFEEYGVVISLLNYYAKPKVSFGYEFIDKHPYFVVRVAKAENLAIVNKSSDTNNETIPQNYYFTKAQAKKLKEFMSEENIQSFRIAEENEFINSGSETDNY